jgi:trk system potassium uptake protein TrkH
MVGKLVPKLKTPPKSSTESISPLTAAEMFLLVLGGMPLFDSAAARLRHSRHRRLLDEERQHRFYGSAYIDWVITIFMVLFGINFNLYFFLLLKNFKTVFKSEAAGVYLGLFARRRPSSPSTSGRCTKASAPPRGTPPSGGVGHDHHRLRHRRL